jgi:two-component system response regulator RegA
MSRLGQVLIVDDNPDVLTAAEIALRRDADAVTTLASTEALGATVTGAAFDVVLLDMNFLPGERSGRAGLDALTVIRACDPALSVVLTTAYGGVSLAVEGLKQGAADLVLKPWRNAELVEVLANAATTTRAQRSAADTLNLDEIERRAIERALARFEGNISQAAAALGLTRPALYRRMQKHGL